MKQSIKVFLGVTFLSLSVFGCRNNKKTSPSPTVKLTVTPTPTPEPTPTHSEKEVIKLYHSRYWNVFVTNGGSLYEGHFQDIEYGSVVDVYTFRIKRIDEELDEETLHHEIVVPNSFTFGDRFTLNNKRIQSHAMMPQGENNRRSDYDDITDLYIADDIEIIESQALYKVPESVTIHCVSPKKPEGWAEDWYVAEDGNNPEVLWGDIIPENLKKQEFPKVSGGFVTPDASYFY